jgi:hypothetical protein
MFLVVAGDNACEGNEVWAVRHAGCVSVKSGPTDNKTDSVQPQERLTCSVPPPQTDTPHNLFLDIVHLRLKQYFMMKD